MAWWGTLFVAPSLLFGVLPGRRMRTGFFWGWWWGFLYGLTLGYSLTYLIQLRTGSPLLSGLGWVLVAGLSALFMGLFGALAVHMPRTVVGALGIAGLWTLTQWARGLGPFAFVWGHFAVALAPMPIFIQPADLGGAWFVEFLVALWNALLGLWLSHRWTRNTSLQSLDAIRTGRRLRIALLALAFWWLWYGIGQYLGKGIVETSVPILQPTTVVAIVQPNVNLARTYSPDEWERIRVAIESLVREAGKHTPSLIVLPESLEPYPMPDNAFAFDRWRTLAQELKTPILLGGYRLGDPVANRWTNTAHLFLPDGSWQYHDKVQLVPLGETVPFRKWLPFLSAFGVVEDDILPGKSLQPLQVGNLRIGVVVCMESTYPWIARTLVREGANLLVVGSNESWFGRTPALEQHLAFSILRAVETGRWLVRSAPEGVSAFIASTGDVFRLPAFEPVAKVKAFPIWHDTTSYVRWGDWIVPLSGLLVVCAWATTWRRPNI